MELFEVKVQEQSNRDVYIEVYLNAISMLLVVCYFNGEVETRHSIAGVEYILKDKDNNRKLKEVIRCHLNMLSKEGER